MTDTYKYHDPDTKLLIKTGGNYNLFKVVIMDEQYCLLNIREQMFTRPGQDEYFYAVKWILQ